MIKNIVDQVNICRQQFLVKWRNKIMGAIKNQINLVGLLVLNVVMFLLHIKTNYFNVLYFCQLTNMSSILVILNFFLSIVLHQRKSSHKTRKFLSNFHLMTISVQTIVFIGFWGLRIFFNKGIIDPRYERNFMVEIMSVWVHGGSLLTLFYFIKTDQIVLVQSIKQKYLVHLCWTLTFLCLQITHWYVSDEHVYGFLKYFTWPQIIVFQFSGYFGAIAIDYYLNLRHGLKLTISRFGRESITEWELEKENKQAQQYLNEDKNSKQVSKNSSKGRKKRSELKEKKKSS